MTRGIVCTDFHPRQSTFPMSFFDDATESLSGDSMLIETSDESASEVSSLTGFVKRRKGHNINGYDSGESPSIDRTPSTTRDEDEDGLTVEEDEGREGDLETVERGDLLRPDVLHGRENEVQLLRDAFDRISSSSSSSEAMLLHGESGAGKSFLVEKALREYVTIQKDGFFVMGKYQSNILIKDNSSDDQSSRSNDWWFSTNSFSAVPSLLMGVLSDVCELILSTCHDDRVLRKLRQELKATLTTADIQLLTNMISSLTQLTGSDLTVCDSKTIESAGGTFSQRIRHACCQLLRTLSSERPICFVLDDLQLSDSQSLDILQALITDMESKHVLFVGTYRTDEFNPEERLLALDSMDGISTTTVPLTTLKLNNLSVEHTRVMIYEYLKLHPDTRVQYQELGNLVATKTMGNPYFSIQFLKMLQSRDLLTVNRKYSASSFREWDFDLEKIQSSTDATDNVGSLVVAKLEGLSNRLILLHLKVAACLGFVFEQELHESVVATVEDSFSFAEHTETLEYMFEEGLVEESTNGCFKFTHDQVFAAVGRLLSADTNQQRKLQTEIGETILQRVEEERDCDKKHNWMCIALRNLNTAAMGSVPKSSSEKDRMRLVRLNQLCANRAAERLEFQTASHFAQVGLKLLDKESRWTSHYDLCLDLANTAVHMESCMGNLEKVKALAEEVSTHSRTLTDSMMAVDAQIDVMAGQGQLGKAIERSFEVLAALGEAVPMFPTTSQLVYETLKTMWAMYGMTDEKIISLPKMTDKSKLMAMTLLSQTGMHCFLHMKGPQDGERLAILGMRMVQLSIRYGLAPSSCAGFACHAASLSVLKKRSEAYRFSKLAMRIMEETDSQQHQAKTILYAYELAAHWKEPLRDVSEMMKRGYQTGFDNGEIGIACIMMDSTLAAAFYAGDSLKMIYKEERKAMETARSLKQVTALQVMQPPKYFIDNMMGQVRDPSVLFGDPEEERKLVEELEASGHFLQLHVVNHFKLILAYHFEAWPILERMTKLLDSNHGASGHLCETHETFFLGMAYCGLYHQTGDGKYHQGAQRLAKKLKSILDLGCPVQVLMNLLQTEIASQDPKADFIELQEGYQRALVLATEAGNLHMQGLVSECHARMCERRDRWDETERLARQALKYYDLWGAVAKADWLQGFRFLGLLDNVSY